MNEVRPEAYRARDDRRPDAVERRFYQAVPVRTEQPMMKVWSHRPPFLHLGLFFVAYVLGCGFAQALAIVPGITVSIWPPGGVFIATLILAPVPSWPWWILVGCLAEMFAQLVWFHSPLAAGFLIYVGNAIAATIGAWLMIRACGRPVRLETLREVLAFVLLCAGIAPVASATVGSAALEWFGVKSQTFTAVWPLFWIGDATGILLVAPLALVVLQNWRSKTKLTAAQWMEAGVLGLVFLGVAALSMSNYYLPFAYIVMPPLLWAAVRFEFKGVAVALSLLALLTVALTISGTSQFVGDPETQRERQIMLQLFLAISAFSALIVAAISRQHQEALITSRESERSLRDLVETLPAMIYCADPQGEPTYRSRRLREFLGFKPEDIGKTRLAELLPAVIHPDDLAAVKDRYVRSLPTGEPYALKHRIRRFDGEYRWVETRMAPMRNAEGEIVQWNGVAVDIDDEMRAQQALRDRERELSQLVDMVPVHIRRLSPEGETISFNKRLIDFVGMDVEELGKCGMNGLAGTIQTFIHPNDSASLLETIRRSLATGKGYATKYRLRRADGVYRWMEGRGEPLRDQTGAIVQWYGISIDIDDEMRAQQAEEALRHASDKLAQATHAASLAELSASIAHEVNQPLAAIVANSHACQRWLSAEPPNVARAKITAERITRDANSAADVVSRIRALFKQSAEPRSSVALMSVVAEARDLMAEEAAQRRIRLDVDVESDVPPIAFDRVQIQQVLVNLIRNGMDAMDSAASDKAIGIRVRRAGDVVRTEISDRGRGIEVPDRIFDPFYTTKEHGMGMGLAICRSIVESHRGRLWVEKNEPQGARFIFTLPVAMTDHVNG